MKTNSHSKPKDLQKKLQKDLEEMFDLEFQRNEINFALSGVERGEITHQDIKEDMSLAVSNYFVKDVLQRVVEAQRTESQLQLLDELEKVNDKSLGESWLVIDDFITNKRQELAETGDYMSEDKEHTHRASRRSYEHHALFCRCGAFRNEVGKWVEPKDQTTLDQTNETLPKGGI